MITIGITGGIGSGKTTICEVFKTFGIPVYYSDLHARYLTDNDKSIRDGICDLLGSDVFFEGKLDRKKVAERVFNDRVLLDRLNGIIHPVVEKDFENWRNKHAETPIVLKEAAILFECGGYKAMDLNILVVAPEDLRINRVMKRDGVTKELVLHRMKNQWDDDKKKNLADCIIRCNEKDLVVPQVIKILNHI
ncbi:dephospho-CoA kinase [Marinilabiliaceae bacterium JC017]|nr:dephospho-CoA kinase [Marinilabiliaceae bacterium JC017]